MQSLLPPLASVILRKSSLLTFFVLLVALLQGCGAAEEVPDPNAGGNSPVIESDVILGGLLYDHWIDEPGFKGKLVPTGVNPLWLSGAGNPQGPEGNAVKTWRCKQCHGWDYKGVDGAYGSDPTSPNYSKFGAIFEGRLGIREKSIEEISTYLTNGFLVTDPVTRIQEARHNFGEWLPQASIAALAAFVKEGVIETDQYISKLPSGGQVGPDHLNMGEELYIGTGRCSECHGEDGLGQEGVDLGDVAREDPWEVLHKIRFGSAGSNMPSALEAGLSNEDAAAILGHAMTFEPVAPAPAPVAP